MRITSRRKAIAFFLALGICLVALAIALNIGWVILNWSEGVFLFFGVIFFAAIILGMILNTGFLVREIRRNEQHDSFINAVTHELKTPITSIRLYLETLQRRDVEEAQRQEFYRSMLLDTERLLGTVEQVLKAGEANYRGAARHWIGVDFGALVRDCVAEARSRHHVADGALRYEPLLGEASSRVEGDPEKLRTAISNLLDNAIKYSGATVNVAVELAAPDAGRMVLRVRDAGVGIPAHELKRIFKRFYRVPAHSRPGIKGTGLGLFIVRSIARTHGGRVFAESEGEGRGTTFTFELPRSGA